MTTDDPQADAEEEHPGEANDDPIAALEGERDQYKALAQRTQADFVNFKHRVDQERGMVSRNASGQVIGRLLPVLDDLQRAVSALPEDAPESWGNGVTMILQNLQALVAAEGIAAYEPVPGDTFDPVEHEAVYYQPTEQQPPGAVLSVVSPGYRSTDRVLRPAQVVVASAATEPDPSGQADLQH
jgi:molecular chaperone GrpE